MEKKEKLYFGDWSITLTGVGVRRGSVIFKELATESLTMLEEVYEQHKLELYFFILFAFALEEAVKVGMLGVALRGLEFNGIGIHCMKLLNNQ